MKKKTLKKYTLEEILLRASQLQCEYPLMYRDLLKKEKFIREVDLKEWFEQKLNMLPNRLEYYHSNEPEQMQTLGKVKVLKGLSEEISMPEETAI